MLITIYVALYENFSIYPWFFWLIGSDKIVNVRIELRRIARIKLSVILNEKDNLDRAIPEIRLDIDVGGNHARLSKRQEVKYLTTRFDVSVVLRPSSVYFFVRRGLSAATKP